MMIIHELGHVLGACITGGTVEKVILHPLYFSRTDLSHNPHPLFVVWSGPLFGTLAPLLIYQLTTFLHLPARYLFRFFSGFCLITNGLYIGLGWIIRAGDAGDLLRLGSPLWLLILFGIITVPTGFYLWHNLGSHFGLKSAQGKVNPTTAYICFFLLVLIVTIEIMFFKSKC